MRTVDYSPGAGSGSGSGYGGGATLLELTLAGDNRFRHPMPQNMVDGLFTAPASGKVDVVVDLHGNNLGLAYANLGVIIGEPVNDRLRTAGQYAPLLPGVQRKLVGRGLLDDVVDHYIILNFEDLEPGVEHMIALEAAIVGGVDSLPITTPTDIIVNLAETKAYVMSATGGANAITPVTLGGRPHWLFQGGSPDFVAGTPIANAFAIYRAAMTPDGAKIVGTQTVAGGVAILTTATETVANLVDPVGGGTLPYPVVCRTNAEAIVGFTGTSRIHPLNLTNNTWGAAVSPGRDIISLACNPDGSLLWAGGVDGVLLRYEMPGFLNATFLDIGGRIEDIAYTPDRLWCALPNELRSINPTTFATIDSIALPSTPNRVRVTADGKVVWVVLQNGMVRYYSTSLFAELPPNNEHDSVDLGAGGSSLSLTSDEFILVSVDSTLTVWPGSTLGVLVDSGDGPGGIGAEFLDHGLTVKVIAA